MLFRRPRHPVFPSAVPQQYRSMLGRRFTSPSSPTASTGLRRTSVVVAQPARARGAAEARAQPGHPRPRAQRPAGPVHRAAGGGPVRSAPAGHRTGRRRSALPVFRVARGGRAADITALFKGSDAVSSTVLLVGLLVAVGFAASVAATLQRRVRAAVGPPARRARHRLQPHRHHAPDPLGQNDHVVAIRHLPDHRGPRRRPRRQHSQISTAAQSWAARAQRRASSFCPSARGRIRDRAGNRPDSSPRLCT